jgi:hypothetical protein
MGFIQLAQDTIEWWALTNIKINFIEHLNFCRIRSMEHVCYLIIWHDEFEGGLLKCELGTNVANDREDQTDRNVGYDLK